MNGSIKGSCIPPNAKIGEMEKQSHTNNYPRILRLFWACRRANAPRFALRRMSRRRAVRSSLRSAPLRGSRGYAAPATIPHALCLTPLVYHRLQKHRYPHIYIQLLATCVTYIIFNFFSTSNRLTFNYLVSSCPKAAQKTFSLCLQVCDFFLPLRRLTKEGATE